jgi:DNA-binding beta-propeller fold protein YncE
MRAVIIISSFFFLTSCLKEKALQVSNYPDEVGYIVTQRCATQGCHTSQSKQAAGGLAMETWDKLFEGGSGGSVVIPYRPDQSWFMFYTNTDTNLGVALTPTMPFNESPLSSAEYNILKSWIEAGAPSKEGEVAFSGNPGRKKFYVANQGCDVLTVFDTESKLAMRYIDVGSSTQIEAPHQLRFSPDKEFFYMVFAAGSVIQKFRTIDDSFAGEADIGAGSWNTFTISPDGKTAFAVDWVDNGRIARIDLENMQLLSYYQGSNLFVFPHGIAADNNFANLYVTAQYGNTIYKIDIANQLLPEVEKLSIVPGQLPNTLSNTYDPHEIIFRPDGQYYFITCQASNEVRVMQTANDSLVKVIPVGTLPLEMAVSMQQPYLFVTCSEDACAEEACRGSVYVINYNDFSVVKVLQNGMYQPHGIALDEESRLLVVVSRNFNPDGPPPHHASTCGGRNGFIQLFDLNTLDVLDEYETEVSVDPYSVIMR